MTTRGYVIYWTRLPHGISLAHLMATESECIAPLKLPIEIAFSHGYWTASQWHHHVTTHLTIPFLVNSLWVTLHSYHLTHTCYPIAIRLWVVQSPFPLGCLNKSTFYEQQNVSGYFVFCKVSWFSLMNTGSESQWNCTFSTYFKSWYEFNRKWVNINQVDVHGSQTYFYLQIARWQFWVSHSMLTNLYSDCMSTAELDLTILHFLPSLNLPFCLEHQQSFQQM